MITSVCFALVCYFQTPTRVFVDRVAIKVNDKILTQRELLLIYKQLRAGYLSAYSGTELDEKLKEAWDQAVTEGEEQLLFYEKAVELGVAYSRDEILDGLNSIKESNGLTDAELEQEIQKQMGMTLEEFVGYNQRDRSRQVVIQREIVSKIQIDDSEIAKYYEENINEFMEPETYRISEIVVFKEGDVGGSKRSRILEAEKALQAGTPFAEAAQNFSETPTKSKGGDLGLAEFGDLNPILESAAKAMSVGQVSQILETEFAYFLIKLEERNPPTPKPIDSVHEDILNKLRLPRLTTNLKKYVENLKAEYLLETILKKPPAYLEL